MVTSININYVRNLCDKKGFDTKLTDSGNLILRLDADNDYNKDVVILYMVDDNRLTAYGVGGVDVDQDEIAEALIRINRYNENSVYLTAFLTDDGSVRVTRSEYVDCGVSEKFIDDFIGSTIGMIWRFYKENFNDF